ncbi:transposase [Streptomyces profundus]|uniref:transposase n=1 Tax=Streptomyces profundus TaxID=2867410 RepID=UPI0031451B79
MARRQGRARAVLALQPARNHSAAVLVRTAKLRWRIENDYREMKQALGLAHFEGRTWPGWHHHVTLVSVAHAFCTLQGPQRPGVSDSGGP